MRVCRGAVHGISFLRVKGDGAKDATKSMQKDLSL
jgi:hypothetical protein